MKQQLDRAVVPNPFRTLVLRTLTKFAGTDAKLTDCADEICNASRWQTPENVPTDRTRVLAAYVGVYEPTTGAIADGRFYPDGGSGSQPFTHWMHLPSVANIQGQTPGT